MALGSPPYVALLPLLERPRAEVLADRANKVRSMTLAAPVEVAPAEVTPGDLLLFALRSESSYWYERAVDWLASGALINGDVADVVKARASDTSLPQGARHRAFALVRHWERSTADAVR